MTYLTIQNVSDRLLGSSYSALWLALTVDQQNYGIKQAQRKFETLNHQGKKYDSNQELQFPRNIQGCQFDINDDMLQGLSIESYYHGGNVSQDTVLISADQSLIVELQDDTKVVYANALKSNSKYTVMGFKSIEACELIYPYLAKTSRY